MENREMQIESCHKMICQDTHEKCVVCRKEIGQGSGRGMRESEREREAKQGRYVKEAPHVAEQSRTSMPH